jgi:hypothetical protein
VTEVVECLHSRHGALSSGITHTQKSPALMPGRVVHRCSPSSQEDCEFLPNLDYSVILLQKTKQTPQTSLSKLDSMFLASPDPCLSSLDSHPFSLPVM